MTNNSNEEIGEKEQKPERQYAPKVLCRLEATHDSPGVEIGRQTANFFWRALLEDTPTQWQLIDHTELGAILTGPHNNPIKQAIVTSLHRQQVRAKGGGRPRVDNPSPATAAVRAWREREKKTAKK